MTQARPGQAGACRAAAASESVVLPLLSYLQLAPGIDCLMRQDGSSDARRAFSKCVNTRRSEASQSIARLLHYLWQTADCSSSCCGRAHSSIASNISSRSLAAPPHATRTTPRFVLVRLARAAKGGHFFLGQPGRENTTEDGIGVRTGGAKMVEGVSDRRQRGPRWCVG